MEILELILLLIIKLLIVKNLIKNESLAIIIKGIGCPTLITAIDNFKEAKESVEMYIQLYNLAGSTFKGAIIYHPNKGAFAYVSYNGRIWKGTKQFDVYATREEITSLTLNDY